MSIFKTEDCPICENKTNAFQKTLAKYNGKNICKNCYVKIINSGINALDIKRKSMKELKEKVGIKSIPTNVNSNLKENLEIIEKYTSNQKKVIYNKLIEVTHTNYDGRQAIIKELYNNHTISKEVEGNLIDCESDIEDGKMMSGKKCVKVVVRNSNGYNDELGYIPFDLIDELHENAGPQNGYSTDLYAFHENNEYKLRIRVKFYKL